MIKHLTILLLLLSINTLFANPNHKSWRDGPITWSDFRGVANGSSNNSYLSYKIVYSRVDKQINDTSFIFLEANAFIIKNESWVDEQNRTEQNLRYNQVIFNLIELKRRELQDKLYSSLNEYEAKEELKITFDACQEQIKKFQNFSNFGNDKDLIDDWYAKSYNWLKEFEIPERPLFKPSKFSLGFTFGGAYNSISDSLSTYVANPFGFNIGMEANYKSIMLVLNGSVGFSEIGKDFSYDGLDWKNNTAVTVTNANICIGQSIINDSKLRITPIVGANIFEIARSDNEDLEENFRIYDYTLNYGIICDINFVHYVNFINRSFGSNSGEISSHYLRLRLDYTNGKVADFNVNSLNLSLSWYFGGRFFQISD